MSESHACFGDKSFANTTQGCKASELIGKRVKNPADDQLGAVNDLVVDVPTGRILFAS